jgi:YidC/Oxa1 family membrane protein insertase
VLDPFFDLFATLLAWFYGIVPSFGVAIILLTLAVMLLVTPLTLKGTRSMLELQMHQPELRKIQTQYRDDRQKMNEELMKFYAEHKINPLGGCLPLLIQLPVFIILYNVIRGLTTRTSLLEATLAGDPSLAGHFDPKYLDESSELYQALHGNNQMVSFGIDLARTPLQAMSDGLGTAWPYLLLVVGIAVTSYVQQRQIQGRNSGAINPQMQMITRVMPIMFVFFSLNFPAGLAVYWCTSGMWRIGQQYIIGKHIYTEETKARLEQAKARNEAVAGAAGNGQPGQGGFLDKLLGGAQPNLKAGRDGDGKSAAAKQGSAKAGAAKSPTTKGASGKTPAGGTAPTGDGGSAAARPTGRVTTPGSRPAASRKRKKRK